MSNDTMATLRLATIGGLKLGLLIVTLAACGEGHNDAGRAHPGGVIPSGTAPELTPTPTSLSTDTDGSVDDDVAEQPTRMTTLTDVVLNEVDHMFPQVLDVSLDRSSAAIEYNAACVKARTGLSDGRSVGAVANAVLEGLRVPADQMPPFVYGLELFLFRGGCGQDPMLIAVGPALSRAAQR